jgi:branched-chain amino acid transport system substrate-binding protein
MGQGYEHLRFPPPALNNMYVTVNFMEELAADLGTDFPERIRALYPDAEYVGMEAAAEYEGINLYALAAEQAGTTEKDAVRQALETGITFEGPGGPVMIDPATHHTVRNIYLVHADEEHNIILDDTFEAVRPDWLSADKGCNLPEKPEAVQYEP